METLDVGTDDIGSLAHTFHDSIYDPTRNICIGFTNDTAKRIFEPFVLLICVANVCDRIVHEMIGEV